MYECKINACLMEKFMMNAHLFETEIDHAQITFFQRSRVSTNSPHLGHIRRVFQTGQILNIGVAPCSTAFKPLPSPLLR